MTPPPVRNYFAHATAAQRYTRYRPYFHPRLMERIRQRLGLTEAVLAALDVGCGTGDENIETVSDWLIHEMTPFFGAERLPFTFVGSVTYFQTERREM